VNRNFNDSICIRQKQLLAKIPFSKATLWRKVRNGTFPKPFKLSEKVTVWQVSDIEEWLEKLRSKASGVKG